MLKEFGHEIWIADGREVAVAGFRYPTRMAVLRLSDGGLFIWSPTPLTDDLRAAVNSLGPVRHIIAPNSLHQGHFVLFYKINWRRCKGLSF